MASDPAPIRIEPWTDGDLPLLQAINAPEMTRHLGGPETDEQVLRRHQRYLTAGVPGSGQMFRIVLAAGDTPVGSVGYWERGWRDETVYEMGWGVLPGYQGRGIAVAATLAAAAQARAAALHRYAHAFPKLDHPASNAICRRAGFALLGPCDFEYPPGNPIRCNDWRLDLASLVP